MCRQPHSLSSNGVLRHLLQACTAPVTWLETGFGLALQVVPQCGSLEFLSQLSGLADLGRLGRFLESRVNPGALWAQMINSPPRPGWRGPGPLSPRRAVSMPSFSGCSHFRRCFLQTLRWSLAPDGAGPTAWLPGQTGWPWAHADGGQIVATRGETLRNERQHPHQTCAREKQGR